jgi:hypothetical protein
MHIRGWPDAARGGGADDRGMVRSYGVVWREAALPPAAGKLELRARRLRLEGIADARPVLREIGVREPERRAHEAVRALLDAGPPFDPEQATGLVRHEVFLTP